MKAYKFPNNLGLLPVSHLGLLMQNDSLGLKQPLCVFVSYGATIEEECDADARTKFGPSLRRWTIGELIEMREKIDKRLAEL